MRADKVFVCKDKDEIYVQIFVYDYKKPRCYYAVLKDPEKPATDENNWSYYEVTEFKNEDSYFEALEQEKKYYKEIQKGEEK